MKLFKYVAILLLSASPLAAQLPSVPIDSGTQVRARTAADRTTGHLLARYARGDEALRLRCADWEQCTTSGDLMKVKVIPSRELLRLEVRNGTGAKTGAIIGGITGTVVGGFFGMLFAGICDAADCPSPARGALAGGVLGGFTVGLVGAGIGSLVPRWKAAP